MTTALGRAADTHEITDLIMYLASDKGAFVIGVNTNTLIAMTEANQNFSKVT